MARRVGAASRYDAAMEGGATVEILLRHARSRIDPVDAQWLLAHALGRERAWLYAHGDGVLDPATCDRFGALVDRRANGEPVAYLTARRGFWTFELEVTSDTLIPRPETELVVSAPNCVADSTLTWAPLRAASCTLVSPRNCTALSASS